MVGLEKIDLFKYTDYRAYLEDKFLEKKKRNPRYSHRVFSKKAGLKSSNFLNLVIKGERNLTANTILKFAQALELNHTETQYFENLVLFNQTKSLKDKDYYFKKSMEVARKECKSNKAKYHNEYDFFAQWYHSVVWALLDMYTFEGNFKWLAKKISPPISTQQARDSVQLLESLQLVEKNKEGNYRVTHNKITTGDSVRSIALTHFYQQTLSMGSDAVKDIPRDQRNISGITMGISKLTYETIVDKITSFRKELVDIVSGDKNPDRVYQLNFPLIPLSQISERDESDE